MNFFIPQIIVNKLEAHKPGTAARLIAAGRANNEMEVRGIFLDSSLLAGLVASGDLPNQSPFVPPTPLTDVELAILRGPGPGTELAKLLEEIVGAKAFAGCGCNSWIIKMNRWGLEGCHQNMDAIVQRLKDVHSKLSPGQPFKPIAAQALVEQAIENVGTSSQKSGSPISGSDS